MQISGRSSIILCPQHAHYPVDGNLFFSRQRLFRHFAQRIPGQRSACIAGKEILMPITLCGSRTYVQFFVALASCIPGGPVEFVCVIGTLKRNANELNRLVFSMRWRQSGA
jgi:hypothetical protein